MQNSDYLINYPAVVQIESFSYLTRQELAVLPRVSRQLNTTVSHERLWKKIALKEGISCPQGNWKSECYKVYWANSSERINYLRIVSYGHYYSVALLPAVAIHSACVVTLNLGCAPDTIGSLFCTERQIRWENGVLTCFLGEQITNVKYSMAYRSYGAVIVSIANFIFDQPKADGPNGCCFDFKELWWDNRIIGPLTLKRLTNVISGLALTAIGALAIMNGDYRSGDFTSGSFTVLTGVCFVSKGVLPQGTMNRACGVTIANVAYYASKAFQKGFNKLKSLYQLWEASRG